MWSRWAIYLWIFILSLLATYEGYDLLSGNKHTPPLTQVVVRYVPKEVTLTFLLWLLLHFALRYFNPTYVAWVRSR